jgi:hypothetical protein
MTTFFSTSTNGYYIKFPEDVLTRPLQALTTPLLPLLYIPEHPVIGGKQHNIFTVVANE